MVGGGGGERVGRGLGHVLGMPFLELLDGGVP